ncbi:MAG: adenylyl-sulfate kinase [Candidatus Omnitrophota bacterium]|nr:MAG: adenylyl-sulfate kinase [Candidatus Omnitrophota bacterium]
MKKTLRTTLWFTGLPCSGKTTLAKRLKDQLDRKGFDTTHLDGDEIRESLNKDLGFSEEDRKENLRRVAHIAKLFNRSGIFVIASFVSPTNDLRKMVKKIIGDFKLVYVKCDIDECKKRDTKGMYKRARLGEIPEFTGISAPFEEPDSADMVVDTRRNNIEECVKMVLDKLNIGSQKRILTT